MEYSVLYEPCIPVQMMDGSIRLIGMRETLLEAHKIMEKHLWNVMV